MAVPTVTPLPIPPNRTSGAGEFAPRADIFFGAMPQFQVDINTVAAFVDQRAIDADASATAAANSAGAAAASAAMAASVETDVSEQIARAEAAANNAAASALAAESAPGSIGNLALLHSTALSF